MKYLAIALILVAGVAWAGELALVCGPKEIPVTICDTNIAKCKSECQTMITTAITADVLMPAPRCEGVKVYAELPQRGIVTDVDFFCRPYICEGNGYEGKDCESQESRYDQLKKMFKK